MAYCPPGFYTAVIAIQNILLKIFLQKAAMAAQNAANGAHFQKNKNARSNPGVSVIIYSICCPYILLGIRPQYF
jgi:hypothetical protein